MSVDVQTILLILIGLFGSFLSGLLGLGGAIVMLPLLVYVGGVPFKPAVGTILCQTVVAVTFSILAHRRIDRGSIHLPLALTLGAASAAAAFISSFLSALIPTRWLEVLFLLLILLSGTGLVARGGGPRHEKALAGSSRARALGIGALAGALAGTIGAGGSMVMIPLMIRLLGTPVRVAIGTQLPVVLVAVVPALFGKLQTGQVDLHAAVLVSLAAPLGSQLGARLNHRVRPQTLKALLATVLFAAAARMALSLLG